MARKPKMTKAEKAEARERQKIDEQAEKVRKLDELRQDEDRRTVAGGKNTPGYINHYRKVNLIWLIVWVFIGAGIFITGLLIWETRMNLLTVLAVLMVLPGAKRIVALVAAGNRKSVAPERCRRLETAVEPYIYAGNLDLSEYEPEEIYDEDEDAGEAATAEAVDEQADGSGADEVTESVDEQADEPEEAPADEAAEDEDDQADGSGEAEEDQPESRWTPEREIEENVIFTDYIFTSTEKVMMLDFLVVMKETVFIMPSPTNNDQDYVKNYLVKGIRNVSDQFDISFVWDDDKLINSIEKLHEGAAPLKDRRELIAYLKSLAV